MNFLITLITTAVLSFSGVFAIYNYVPLKYFETGVKPRLGATITTILGTDTLSASRSVINTNFANLNADKAEISGGNTYTGLNQFANASTSLFSCYGPCYFGATATSSFSTAGALTLITPLLVASGGTGSSTLSTGQVLIGNGTGNIGVVSGYGTIGQFLTSTGAGTAPTWQTSAIDTAIDYIWTGNHTYNAGGTATTTFNRGVDIDADSDSPLILNGKTVTFPANPSVASSTVLQNNGTGTLNWIPNIIANGQGHQEPNTTGNQVITHGLGVLPRKITITANSITSNGAVACNEFSTGVASLGTTTLVTNQSVVLWADCSTAGNRFASSTRDSIVDLMNDVRTNARASITAVTDSTFTLNWSVNDNLGTIPTNSRWYIWTAE